MKVYLFSFLLFAVSFSAIAQKSAAADSTSKRFYTGIELTTVSYSIGGLDTKVRGSVTPYAQLNFGYRLSRRLNIQIGVGYGRDKESGLSGIYYGHNDTIIYYNRSRDNFGLAVPLSVQYTPFNPDRRLNLYATASLIPVFGEVNQHESETFEGKTKDTYDAHDSGVYVLATAGLVLNYKISQRFEVYGKGNLLYKDLQGYSYYAERAKSVAIGLNYNF